MTAADFTAWVAHMGWTDSETARRLGCGRNSILNWKTNGAPLYIALACAALAYGLPPWRNINWNTAIRQIQSLGI